MGAPFTRCNNQYDGTVTWIRLDKGVATQIPGFKCSHQPMSTISKVHFRIIAHCGFALMMKIFDFTGK